MYDKAMMLHLKESKLLYPNQQAIRLVEAEHLRRKLRGSLISVQECYVPAQPSWSRNAGTKALCINVHTFPQ